MSNIKIKKTLSFKDYQTLINEQINKYKQTIQELQKIYCDFNQVEHLFKLEPMPYLEYCENFDFEPEKHIIDTVKAEEGLKIIEEETKEELYD